MAFTTKTAKRGFFTDSKGEMLIEFQFNPEKLPIQESASISSRNLTGRDDSDLLWVSGASDTLTIDLFVDRTTETRTSRKSGVSQLDVIGNSNPFAGFGAGLGGTSSTVRGVENVVNFLRGKQNTYTEPESLATDYVVNPHLDPQDMGYNENVGVYAEYNKFRAFIKPTDYTPPLTFTKDSVYQVVGASRISMTARTFVPPPVAILFFGDMWVEGYFETLRPIFQVFNKGLIPMRMELSVTMAVHQIGFLIPMVGGPSIANTALGGDTSNFGFYNPSNLA
jgi:hypothetical protein